MGELEGRAALVTGGASGIGRATALRLAQAGARVFVADVQSLPENAALFAPHGIKALDCDVRSESQVAAAVATVEERVGRFDILINNAGIGLVRQVPEIALDEWRAIVEVNLTGAFLGAKHAIPAMRRAGGGAIVNVASNAGILPRAHDPAYSTTKAALIALTKSLALCHARDRIRVSAVCPGPVEDTGMMQYDLAQATDANALWQQMVAASPLAAAENRMIAADEVASAILYLVSPAAAMVTGAVLAIDGGKSLGVPPKS